MIVSTDIAQDGFDLDFSGGDFYTTTSDEWHVRDILFASQGNFRFYPLIGANLSKFAGSLGSFAEVKRIISTALEVDGYVLERLEVDKDGSLKIKAEKQVNTL